MSEPDIRERIPVGVIAVGEKQAWCRFYNRKGEVATNVVRFLTADDTADLETRAGYYRKALESWAKEKGCDIRGWPAVELSSLLVDDDLAFEVRTPAGGSFKVYASGRIDGFGEDCIVVNRIPSIVNVAVANALRGRKAA